MHIEFPKLRDIVLQLTSNPIDFGQPGLLECMCKQAHNQLV